jgi:C4-dicarboxylate transporter DctM subunit
VAVSLIVIMFGMVLEGLPAAVVLVPVVFPIAKEIGIHPVHFNIVLTAAVGIGLFLPPIGVGLLMALRFANISVGQHFRAYWPYLLALSSACSSSSCSRRSRSSCPARQAPSAEPAASEAVR